MRRLAARNDAYELGLLRRHRPSHRREIYRVDNQLSDIAGHDRSGEKEAKTVREARSEDHSTASPLPR